MKYSILALLVFTVFRVSSQELVLSGGINSTTYAYKDALGKDNDNLRESTGNFYELDYTAPINKQGKWYYSLGLSLNEYNAKGGNLARLYTWHTRYLGLQSGLSYSVLSLESGFKTAFSVGMQANTIVNGEQVMNGTVYDLTGEEEFRGVFLKPNVGATLSYPVSDNLTLGLGYNYGESNKLNNTSAEVLNFKNHQVLLRLGIALRQNLKKDMDKVPDTNEKSPESQKNR
tara:strand:+ start:2083 stop:2772 length:690 start_codon:yes stop_codon:yes gene_type:complete